MLVAFMRTLASGCFSTLNGIALIVRMWGAAQSASDAGVMSGTGALAFFSQVRLSAEFQDLEAIRIAEAS
jgi:hypothetical protein